MKRDKSIKTLLCMLPSRDLLATPKPESAVFAFSQAVSILVAPTAVAERAPQEWVPDVLEFSDDLDVLSNREIGSTARMFAIGRHATPDDLIATWEHALRTNGFVIEQNFGDVLERAIEFSGPGIGNAKIVVASRKGTEEANIIEFDATLR